MKHFKFGTVRTNREIVQALEKDDGSVEIGSDIYELKNDSLTRQVHSTIMEECFKGCIDLLKS